MEWDRIDFLFFFFTSTKKFVIVIYNGTYSKVGETMRKRFVAKKRKKKLGLFLKILVGAGLIYFVAQLCVGYLLDVRLASSNEEFVKALLNDSNHHLLYAKGSKNIFHHFIDFFQNVKINQPVEMLEQVFGYKDETSLPIQNDADNQTPPPQTDFIEDPAPVDISQPKVYIYNTHQLENYSANNYEAYNITPNVLMGSYLLREKLNGFGIPTIVETSNITDFLNSQGWSYANSYRASRYYLTAAIEAYPSLELFIDLHRDSIPKASSTATINGKSYAKVLFVVGAEYSGYEANYNFANQINERLRANYPELSRGVIKKEGPGVNGVYNQDLKNQMLLIECGGSENTIDEVKNTIEVLAQIIKETMG